MSSQKKAKRVYSISEKKGYGKDKLQSVEYKEEENPARKRGFFELVSSRLNEASIPLIFFQKETESAC